MYRLETIIKLARRHGLTLWVEKGQIGIAPARFCPPALLAAVRANKPRLITLLQARAAGLRDDEIPWLYTARQILDGEFDWADSACRESLTVGLRSIRHPDCQAALERVRELEQKP
jgi:hypothetical protein